MPLIPPDLPLSRLTRRVRGQNWTHESVALYNLVKSLGGDITIEYENTTPECGMMIDSPAPGKLRITTYKE